MPEKFGAAVTRALSKTVRLATAQANVQTTTLDNQRRDQPQVDDSNLAQRAAKRRSLKPGRSAT